MSYRIEENTLKISFKNFFKKSYGTFHMKSKKLELGLVIC